MRLDWYLMVSDFNKPCFVPEFGTVKIRTGIIGDNVG